MTLSPTSNVCPQPDFPIDKQAFTSIQTTREGDNVTLDLKKKSIDNSMHWRILQLI